MNMKKTLTRIAMISILLASAGAGADETRAARPAATRAARRTRARATGGTRDAGATSSSGAPLIRGYGSCDAETFGALVAELGRITAMEQCVGGSHGSAAAARELSRTEPRQTDLGIPDEAFDPDFSVGSL